MKKADFSEFDYIFGMDDENMSDLRSMAPAGCKAKIEMLSRYESDPGADSYIRDPYYVSLCTFTIYFEQYFSCFGFLPFTFPSEI